MERLMKVACYFRWLRSASPSLPSLSSPPSPPFPLSGDVTLDHPQPSTPCPSYRRDDDDAVATPPLPTTTTTTTTTTTIKTTTKSSSSSSYVEDDSTRFDVARCNIEASKRLCAILQSILLWENSVNSISVVVVFNILFWGIIVLEVRGFAAASSVVLVIVLCYSTLEAQIQKENRDKQTLQSKAEQIEKIGRKVKSTIRSLKQLRKEQPGAFCTALCSVSLGLWIIGRTINGALFIYVICMGILLGPALLLKLPGKIISHKEWDSEIDEFLPPVTEDSLQVLRRAGESGDHSPTPSSVQSDVYNEFFNEDDLSGLKMPSHDDGSIDDMELSELELSTGDTEIDNIKFQSEHFEKTSSSEEEGELQPEPKKLANLSDESDSDFEIIDSREAANLHVT